jgi:hypothetical protein
VELDDPYTGTVGILDISEEIVDNGMMRPTMTQDMSKNRCEVGAASTIPHHLVSHSMH